MRTDLKTVVLALVIGIIPGLNLAQSTTIKTEVSKAVDYHDNALKEIELALLQLAECEDSRSASNIKDYSQEAVEYFDRAKRLIISAKYVVEEAKEKASKADCQSLTEILDLTEGGYYDAEKHMTDALKELRRVKYEYQLTSINFQISSTHNYIKQAKKKLNAVFIILNLSNHSLEDCE